MSDISTSSKDIPKSSTNGFKRTLEHFNYQAPSTSPTVPQRLTRSASRSSISSPAPSPTGPSPSFKVRKPSASRKTSNSSSKPRTPRKPAADQTLATTVPSPDGSPTNLLTDALAPNLHVLFVGVNPGLTTAATGFAYAHPSNRFYPLLHTSGLTAERHPPSAYRWLVHTYGLGHTNVVARATRAASGLATGEMPAGIAAVEAKVRKWRPGCVVLVGKGVWEAVVAAWKVAKREGVKRWVGELKGGSFEYGWKDVWMGGEEGWEGARVFVATSTSGLAAGVSQQEKERVWKVLGDWVQDRRARLGRVGTGFEEEVYEARVDGMVGVGMKEEDGCAA